MSNNTTNTQAADQSIITDAAMIDMWRWSVAQGLVTREEAIAHLASIGLTL